MSVGVEEKDERAADDPAGTGKWRAGPKANGFKDRCGGACMICGGAESSIGRSPAGKFLIGDPPGV